MPASTASGVGDVLVERLLDLPTSDRQTAVLQAEHLLNPDGLAQLLDIAGRLVRDDPGKARRIATLCATAAEVASAPAAVPRATYIQAQAHAYNAEFDTALSLIEVAREGYDALGDAHQALRTNAGRMNVLIGLGRYGEALEAGRT